MVFVAWILFIASYLIPGIDWNLMIFLVLTVVAFCLVADWLISDTKTRKREKESEAETGLTVSAWGAGRTLMSRSSGSPSDKALNMNFGFGRWVPKVL